MSKIHSMLKGSNWKKQYNKKYGKNKQNKIAETGNFWQESRGDGIFAKQQYI